MNEDIKQKWVAALRSGEYKQGFGRLRSIKGDDSFCCLGVLCDIHAKENNISWGSLDDTSIYLGSELDLPGKVMDWAALSSKNPVFPVEVTDYSLAGINDLEYSFEFIADMIEKHL